MPIRTRWSVLVAADDYAGLPLLTSGGVQLQVREVDAERARQVIEEAEAFE